MREFQGFFDSLEMYYPVLNQLPVMIGCTDSQGNWIYFNRQWLLFAGATLDQEKEYGWTERIHPADFDGLIARFATAFDSQSTMQCKYRMLNSLGEYRNLESIANPIYNPSGEFLGYISLTYDITTRENTLKALQESERLYSSLFNKNSQVILLINPTTGEIVDANPAACLFYGYTKEKMLTLKAYDINTLPKDKLFQIMNSVGYSEPKHFSFQHRLANGEVKDVESHLARIVFSEKQYLFSIVHDETKRKAAARQLKEAYTELNQIFNSTADGMRVIDLDYNVLRINKKLLDMIGITEAEALGKKCYELLPSANCKSPNCPVYLIKQGQSIVEYEAEKMLTDGRIIPISIVAAPFKDSTGNTIGIVESLRDVSKRKKYEERINYLAYHDYLTGLPNSIQFKKELERELLLSRRKDGKFAVMFLDLDDFKVVNDTIGHSAGDQLLVEVAGRLLQVVRKIDVVARVGGDEFTFLIADIKNLDEVAQVAQRILHALEQPFTIKNKQFFISASIGISVFPTDSTEVEELLKKADSSMYWVKRQGKNSYAFYSSELRESALSRLKLLNDLKQAIEQDEFVIYYQPQYHARTQKIVGLEALVRWKHPELGLVPPANFIPLAEETGLIIPLGQKLLRNACLQSKRWQEEGLPPVRIAVNISAFQLIHHDFVKFIGNTLSETGLDPSYLELEITESVAMEKGAANTLKELKTLGVRIALDDFGTGYSSLSCLSVNPIDVIKIDRTFVNQLTNKNNKAIISAIIAMACTLGMEVVAEGVETKAQLAFLKRTNCRYLQGYMFSKPLPPEEIQKLLVKERERLKAI